MIDFKGILSIAHWSNIAQGVFLYIPYSFGNYWFHRWKHSNAWLWRNIHSLHHSPAHMETLVAFFRHPLEIIFNTVYLLLVGKLLFGVSVEAIALALAIEGCLETFHHANIRISKRLYWLGYIIQLPHMHLVHHEYGRHKYNYSPFCWDAIFQTVVVHHKWNKRLGFADSDSIEKYFLLKND